MGNLSRSYPNPPEPTLSPKEAGRVLDVTGAAIKQWIYGRELRAIKLENGYWRVPISGLEAFIQARNESSHQDVLLVGAKLRTVNSRATQLVDTELTVVTAQGLDAGLMKARSRRPSLAVIDLKGFKAGWLLAERIRNSGHIKAARILLLTDRAFKEPEINRALGLGVQGCLSHQIDGEAFRREVEKAIGQAV